MGTYNDVVYDNENVSWSFRLNNKLTLPGKIDWQTRMNVRGPNETAISKSDGDFSIDLAFNYNSIFIGTQELQNAIEFHN